MRPMDFRSRALAFAAQHRRRLVGAAVMIGMLVVGAQLARQLPTDTHIRYDLGPDHAEVKEVRVAFLHGDETTVRSITRRFPNGAPETFDDTVALTRGTYRVHALVMSKDGDINGILRGIRLPVEGTVNIDLFNRAFARRAP
jgi:hypothetical protein